MSAWFSSILFIRVAWFRTSNCSTSFQRSYFLIRFLILVAGPLQITLLALLFINLQALDFPTHRYLTVFHHPIFYGSFGIVFLFLFCTVPLSVFHSDLPCSMSSFASFNSPSSFIKHTVLHIHNTPSFPTLLAQWSIPGVLTHPFLMLTSTVHTWSI